MLKSILKTKKILYVFLYVVFVFVVYLTSSTLAKYSTKQDPSGNFNIGDKLYFCYERGDLYRNNQVIIGVPINEYIYDENGKVIEEVRRIETMNVAPADTLTYHFSVANVNEATGEQNGVAGYFKISATSILSMPAYRNPDGTSQAKTWNIACTISYRKVYKNGTKTQFKNLTSDANIDLPVYDEHDDNTFMKYEFQVYVVLDDQVRASSDDDYVDATSTIYLFIDATNND